MVGDAVPEHLRLAPISDEAFLAHFGEVLRKRRLRQVDLLREERDSDLAVPRLLLPSIQVNIRAGQFPEAEDNGVRYLRIPVKEKPA